MRRQSGAFVASSTSSSSETMARSVRSTAWRTGRRSGACVSPSTRRRNARCDAATAAAAVGYSCPIVSFRARCVSSLGRKHDASVRPSDGAIVTGRNRAPPGAVSRAKASQVRATCAGSVEAPASLQTSSAVIGPRPTHASRSARADAPRVWNDSASAAARRSMVVVGGVGAPSRRRRVALTRREPTRRAMRAFLAQAIEDLARPGFRAVHQHEIAPLAGELQHQMAELGVAETIAPLEGERHDAVESGLRGAGEPAAFQVLCATRWRRSPRPRRGPPRPARGRARCARDARTPPAPRPSRGRCGTPTDRRRRSVRREDRGRGRAPPPPRAIPGCSCRAESSKPLV